MGKKKRKKRNKRPAKPPVQAPASVPTPPEKPPTNVRDATSSLAKRDVEMVSRPPALITKERVQGVPSQKRFRWGGQPEKDRILIQISEFAYIRTLLIVALIAVVLYLIYHLQGVLMPVLMGLALAYLINPIVDKMQQKGVKRGYAIWILVFCIFLFLGVSALIFVPMIIESLGKLGSLIAKIPPAFFKAKAWMESTLNIHVPTTWTEAVNSWGKQLSIYAPKVIVPAQHFIAALFSGGMGLLAQLFNLLMIPLFTFYFLKSFETIRGQFLDYVPMRVRDRLLERLDEMDNIISGFVRGQLTVSLIVGTAYLVLLSVVQAPLAPILALGGAVLNVVPYLGFMITYLITVIVVGVEFHFQWQFFAVLIGMGVIHMADVLVITPSVVGEHTGLSEIVVIFAVLAGGQLFGFVGVLLAVPCAAILKVMLTEVLALYKDSDFFRSLPPGS
jgi:predicted PurR-regulated permease PerM